MDAVIFDMDGTLCDVESIRHYVRGDSKNFTAFHNASLFCPPGERAMSIYRHPSTRALATIIVTARDARFERVTRDWLTKYGVEFDALFMRPWGDQRRDSVVKADILTDIVASGFRPVLAVDDRDDIIEVWQGAGIRTIKV